MPCFQKKGNYNFNNFKYDSCNIYSSKLDNIRVSGILYIDSPVYYNSFVTKTGERYFPVFDKSASRLVRPRNNSGFKKVPISGILVSVVKSPLKCSGDRFDGIIFLPLNY